jgi:spore coat polysaccharide biosynthesis predicted glycosyltransferase SpsG
MDQVGSIHDPVGSDMDKKKFNPNLSESDRIKIKNNKIIMTWIQSDTALWIVSGARRVYEMIFIYFTGLVVMTDKKKFQTQQKFIGLTQNRR